MIQQMNLIFIPFISILFLILLGFFLWLVALISFLGTENMGEDRVVWALVILFTGPIGALLWFVMGRPKFQKY
ncbi:MAG: PLDc N-terminal domain-containing protein [Candidatus Thorarchaeota archaeon]